MKARLIEIAQISVYTVMACFFAALIAAGVGFAFGFGIAAGVTTYSAFRSHWPDVSGRIRIWVVTLTAIICSIGADHWYWQASPLVAAKHKCDDIRFLYNGGNKAELETVLQNLAQMKQRWEE